MLGCVQAMLEGNKFLVKFKDSQKRDMGYFLLMQVCYEGEIGNKVNDPIYDLQNKNVNC